MNYESLFLRMKFILNNDNSLRKIKKQTIRISKFNLNKIKKISNDITEFNLYNSEDFEIYFHRTYR